MNWAAFMVLTRWLFKENRYPPVFTIFWEIFFAVLMCLPALALAGTDISVFRAGTWEALAFLGFYVPGSPMSFGITRRRISRRQADGIQFLQPLVGVVVAYFVIGERFTPWLFLGGAMIVSGVWTVNRRRDHKNNGTTSRFARNQRFRLSGRNQRTIRQVLYDEELISVSLVPAKNEEYRPHHTKRSPEIIERKLFLHHKE
ncbi:MAG: DMT family transporter [Cloacibacillus evryensis]